MLPLDGWTNLPLWVTSQIADDLSNHVYFPYKQLFVYYFL